MLSGYLSPSSQRVWIEIVTNWHYLCKLYVTLFTEGVDWNKKQEKTVLLMKRHPLHRGCGLKSNISIANLRASRSPSSQRVWIEIFKWANMLDKPIVTLFTEGVDWNRGRNTRYLAKIRSPSSQRVWIEISINLYRRRKRLPSPSSQRVWIEIKKSVSVHTGPRVTLFTEGVDWNKHKKPNFKSIKESPSSQRVWIEIQNTSNTTGALRVTLFTEGVNWNYLLHFLI